MTENIDTITNEFYNSFQSSHVLLLIGKSAEADEIKNYISKARWSAILTTNTNPEFASYFALDGRRLQTCTSRQELSARFLSREKPLFVQLYGVDGEVEDSAASPFGAGRRKQRKAEDLLRLLPLLLDYVNSLVITGLGSDEDENLLGLLAELLEEEIVQGSVSFWGMDDAFAGRGDIKEWFRGVSERKSFHFYNTPLLEAIRRRESEARSAVEDSASVDVGDDRFFCNQKPVSIDRDELLAIRNIGALLTERTINRIRPLGRNQQKLWFSNFLERSGIGEPQWYGYLPQSPFHVKRSFEDPLVQLVRWALRGWGPDGQAAENRPIILSGAPGSSKSVTLGALAYRIYNERFSPVVFISGAMFSGNSYGSGFRNLADSLMTIQSISGTSVPVLVIWDGSAYREIESDAKRLLTQLKNKGRNVVLVCSSYSLQNDDSEARYYAYDNKLDAFEPCQSSDDAALIDRTECLVIPADRIMSDQECYQFWKKASEYSGISSAQISFLKKKFAAEAEADVFNYYYGLVSVLRERLESSLEGERDKVVRFLEEERPNYVNELLGQKTADAELNPFYQAFLKAGLSREELNAALGADQDEVEDDNWKELLVRANTYIALFSRYKLDVPYSFIYTAITKGGNINPYSESGRELLDTLTTKIPWLSCGENEDEEFVFRFRNSLEARIYLENHSVTGERLVKMVAEALRLYGDSYQHEGYENLRLAQKLQSIVRLMGPNSRYYVSNDRDRRDNLEHRDILAHLDILIEAIEDLFDIYRIPDNDSGFSSLLVTLTREYYGRNVWDQLYNNTPGQVIDYHAPGYSPDDYEIRLSRIARASSIAREREEELEERASLNKLNESGAYYQRIANSLVVEITRCNLEIEALSPQYNESCKVAGELPDGGYFDKGLSYAYQFQKLTSAIRFDPVNGYTYNALFSLFEKEYQGSRCSDETKLEYLAEMMAYVDACVTYGRDIESRGARSDELSDHISKITDFASDVPATIDTVLDGNQQFDTRDASLFLEIYRRFLEEGNPAAILFVARKEIAQIGAHDTLSEAELKRCRKVLDFMTEQRRYSCICSDPNAVAFLVRVAWMTYSGTWLNETYECQTVGLSPEQWRDLHRYCKAYSQVVQPSMQQPLIMLVHALSTLQVEGREPIGYTDAYSIIKPIREEQFNSPYRLKSPFIVCDEHGEPIRYTGQVRYFNGRNGYMDVYGLPSTFGNTTGVYFHHLNLGRNKEMPQEGEIYPDLELGIGYMGFQLYSTQVRKERERHIQ